MKYLKLAVIASTAAGAALLACGGISDPSRQENTLSLSGALTGSDVPNGAHVALVWKSGADGSVAVAADAPVVNGQYSLTVETPPDGYFFTDEGSIGASGHDAVKTQSESVGGQVANPLSRAVAGFLVYVDKNGNGKLDADADTVIGGDHDLSLTCFRGGASLAYEKLRDKTGAVPHPGFNLGWTGGWLQFDHADLTLSSNATLPGIVCGGVLGRRNFPGDGGFGEDAGGGWADSGRGGMVYPDRSDPRLHCAADGWSCEYDAVCPPPAAPSLCNRGGASEECHGGWGEAVPLGGPPPAGWPCPIPGRDAGSPPPPPPGRDAGSPPPPPPGRDAGTQ
ncbi:hypothetical protein LZC95_28350 [Pendulispora brunnea]|uniref:Uncharacterized protein n=1 Tax=Pendulispora brunnea TaxID=2905690 RepID=A0ABZ2JV63_9BACT